MKNSNYGEQTKRSVHLPCVGHGDKTTTLLMLQLIPSTVPVAQFWDLKFCSAFRLLDFFFFWALQGIGHILANLPSWQSCLYCSSIPSALLLTLVPSLLVLQHPHPLTCHPSVLLLHCRCHEGQRSPVVPWSPLTPAPLLQQPSPSLKWATFWNWPALPALLISPAGVAPPHFPVLFPLQLLSWLHSSVRLKPKCLQIRCFLYSKY